MQQAVKRGIMMVLVALCWQATAFSQWYDAAKVAKKAVNLYNSGIEKAQDRNWNEAIQLVQKATVEDARYVDAWLSLGGIYGEMKNYVASMQAYEKAFALDAVYTQPYKLPYSINCAGAGQFDKALQAAEHFLQTPGMNEKSIKSGEYRKKCYQFALDFARTNPEPGYVFAPKNMGDSVNSAELEYFPSFTIDGRKMIFTRRSGGYNEDFYETNLVNGAWTLAKAIAGNVNTDNNEGAQNIAQDGSILFFTGCNFPRGAGSCDLYYSINTPNGWSAPVSAGPNINTEFWESQPCLSPDKRALYFAARGPGSLGGSDIFVSYLTDRGNWGIPQNMGPGINTAGNESSPFLHADNQTFYFTSDGLTGYGGDDLFMVRKQPDGKWGQPVNLGYPINTIENEGSLAITSDGTTAFYASDRSDSRGGLDLYTFPLRKDIQPYKTLWVKGRVYDSKTGAGLPSAVELIDLAATRTVSRVQTDEQGNYLITLPVGKDYAFNVNRKGYLFFSENYSFGKSAPDSTYQRDIPLQPLQKDAIVVLKNIFFETAKFDLQPESVAELDKIIQLLTDNPGLRIEIGGHTDNEGIAKNNITLSNNRAKAVVTYLTSKGIAAGRLTAKGYGAAQPVADNKTEAGRAQNRRTEMKVL